MNGGPAFPVTKPNYQYTGMTLLDYFAGQAMQAIRSTYVFDEKHYDEFADLIVDTANMARTEHEIAELAYRQARAMLEVRKRIEDRQQ
jgi:hypothetical protein